MTLMTWPTVDASTIDRYPWIRGDAYPSGKQHTRNSYSLTHLLTSSYGKASKDKRMWQMNVHAHMKRMKYSRKWLSRSLHGTQHSQVIWGWRKVRIMRPIAKGHLAIVFVGNYDTIPNWNRYVVVVVVSRLIAGEKFWFLKKTRPSLLHPVEVVCCW